jgi:6-phosphogluconolactonase
VKRPEPDLRVVGDVATAAAELFLEVEPRTFVLSGGSTPEAFYRRLAGTSYPWKDVECFFGDERCVPDTDARSNVRMARGALLDHVAARVYPIDGAACDADGYARMLRERFAASARPWFDLVVYGLGSDGHTASLFPGMPVADDAQRLVVRVPKAGLEPFVPRVTMTAPVLSNAAVGVFLIYGADKRAPLAALLRRDAIPAARMAPERLVILADPAAAGPQGGSSRPGGFRSRP